jgi:hypothetical protein
MQNTSHNFIVPIGGAVTSATIDPDHVVPDVDRSNNTFTLSH